MWGLELAPSMREWSPVRLFQVELSQLQRKIFELLPTNIACRMVENMKGGDCWGNERGAGGGGGSRQGMITMTVEQQSGWLNSCERHQAVVLQLDLCRFTALSQTLEPIQVLSRLCISGSSLLVRISAIEVRVHGIPVG